MGALTKAAVVEICEVVDEGYAVLQMEISRSHKENEDLRKKLHLIESIVVRGSGGEQALAGESELVEVEPSAEMGRQADSPQQQRDGGRGEAADVPTGDGEAVGTGRVKRKEELPDVVLIKDEDSDSSDSEEADTKPADGTSSAVSEGIASAVIGRRRRRRSHGNGDAERPSSSEQLEMKTSRLLAGTQSKMSVYTLDSPQGEPGCSGQLAEADEAVCSYSSAMDPDVHLVQDCSLVSPSSGRKVYFSSSMMEDQSPSSRVELDLNANASWTKQSKGLSYPQFHQSESMDGDAFGLKLISISGSASTDCQLSSSRSSALEYENGGNMMNFGLYRDQAGPSQLPPGSLRKRFVCSICSKTYANSQNLEVHTRIHTGERPFSCDQCGKKFTQSAHLRSHLNIHSGERPFVCTVCSKSFIVKYSLKLHMKKYHPNS